MRLLVTGGREYADEQTVRKVITALDPEVVIHGAAPGLDTLAKQIAHELGIPDDAYKADWDGQGRAAGPLRNAKMIREGMPELCVAFPGGRGTADCTSKCKDAGVPVLTVVA